MVIHIFYELQQLTVILTLASLIDINVPTARALGLGYTFNNKNNVWKWRNDHCSERNLCNCVKKPVKNSGLQWGLNPWPRDYRCDAPPTELWSHWHWEQVNCGFICSLLKKWVLNDIWNKSYMNCGNEMKQCLWTVNIAINTITLFLTLKLRRIFNYDLCSDVDDFIVDDEGNPIRQAKKKRRLHGAVHDS